jgi:putative hemolysin
MCTLKSGEKVDAWEYFRAHYQQGPDSAARFCEATGGGYIEDKKQCALPDGKVMDAEEYFRDHQMSGAGG